MGEAWLSEAGLSHSCLQGQGQWEALSRLPQSQLVCLPLPVSPETGCPAPTPCGPCPSPPSPLPPLSAGLGYGNGGLGAGFFLRPAHSQVPGGLGGEMRL